MKPKNLSALLCYYGGFQWCCGKEEASATTSRSAGPERRSSTGTTNTLQISRSRKAVLDRLSDQPESETNRELSFSFLLNNGSTANNANIDDGVIKEELPRTASAELREKKMRRSRRIACSTTTTTTINGGMLPYLCAPVSFTGSRKVNGVEETRLPACSSLRRKAHQC